MIPVIWVHLKHITSEFDYDLGYTYDAKKPHQAVRIGNHHLTYDDVGNVIRESAVPSASQAGYKKGDAPQQGTRGMEGPEALNWYSYVSNNPVNYIDPTGLGREESRQGGRKEG